MSRSFKKVPINRNNVKGMKSQANRLLRRQAKSEFAFLPTRIYCDIFDTATILQNSEFKRATESWDISDYFTTYYNYGRKIFSTYETNKRKVPYSKAPWSARKTFIK